LEQGIALDITDDEVLRQYWKEGGGDETTKPDNGLYILDSLKSWRSDGWLAGGQHYNIHAFAELDHRKLLEVQHSVFLLSGLIAGVALPEVALTQLDNKEIWTVAEGPDRLAGGHCMWVIGYTRTGPVFLTWGQRQVCTWEWWARYCDECYAVVDDVNKFTSNSLLDVPKLERYLQAIQND
jgi:hypothetical protein